jgi:hypothetical protein
MNGPGLSHRKAAFGIVAIFCLCGGVSLYLRGVAILQDNIGAWAMVMGATQGKGGGWWADSFGGAVYILFGSLLLWLLGLAFSVTGLVRAERPRWPAIVGLVLGMVPLGLFLLSWVYRFVSHP